MRRAWVPLPAPTGPNRTRSRGASLTPAPPPQVEGSLSTNEAPVVAHDELSFELAHGIQRHADDDQHGCTRNCQGLEPGSRFHDERQDGHDSQEERAILPFIVKSATGFQT